MPPSSRRGRRRKNLSAPSVYARLRPKCFDGGGHDQNAPGVAKVIEKWTKTTIQVGSEFMFSNGSAIYKYKEVLGPRATQQNVYDAVIGNIDHFIQGKSDGMCMAYGQTGTGKTHTIFGTPESLKSTTFHNDWGIFPRVAHTILMAVQQKVNTHACILSAAGVEFYMGGAADLIRGNRHRILIEPDTHKPMGVKWLEIKSIQDIYKFLMVVSQNRTSTSTKMNQAKGSHAGSSRSHCALILNLKQVDLHSKELRETTFNIVDLAGAERPLKTSDKREDGFEAVMAAMRGDWGEITIAGQAALINYSLFEIAREALLAGSKHRSGQSYAPPRQMATDFLRFIGGIFDGTYKMNMLICFSQAPQNGWESWFSNQYGRDLSKLWAPIKKVRGIHIGQRIKQLREEYVKLKNAIKTKPTSTSQLKYWPRRVGMHDHCKAHLDTLKELKGRMSA